MLAYQVQITGKTLFCHNHRVNTCKNYIGFQKPHHSNLMWCQTSFSHFIFMLSRFLLLWQICERNKLKLERFGLVHGYRFWSIVPWLYCCRCAMSLKFSCSKWAQAKIPSSRDILTQDLGTWYIVHSMLQWGIYPSSI